VCETGSGKEVIARLLHGWSVRAAKPLVGINCGAIPENLIESQLFGHVRGAFTGADRDRPGRSETADRGTVLLDEIGDLPAHIQVKLLRFLDDYEFRRVGEQKMRTVDVRILAATHKDLWKLVRDGIFRQDLLLRLHAFRIQVPALRERPEDVPALVEQFLAEGSKSSPPLRVAPDLMCWLQAHDWPGNVRELRNLCRYLSVRCWGKPEIGVHDLPPEMHVDCIEFLSGTRLPTFTREKRDFERAQIERALRQTDGNITEASRLLGMGRNLLARRIREHRIDRESPRRP
jgi:DNA-binding NtrC family response regulator